ncbi:ComF family protein [Lacunisphaera limnophila]|uniref:ComF family protein n=1 Tax=Lacunisphaera limnophila TaxID=1838286 RepID=UPI0015CFC811|nr:double zinc ribbon domain-containing protein [Lacunisphaera limnophila]
MAKKIYRAGIDVLFPPSCVDCGGVVEAGWYRHLCGPCAARLHVVQPPFCPTCGHPFFGALEENRRCAHCETLAPRFGEGRTAILLQGSGRSLIHTLKYHAGLHVLGDITSAMRRASGYADYVRGAVLVPVPLHPRKHRERRYNQSRLLADCAVQAADGQAEVKELLRRITDTPTQTHFDREARRENLKNAFALAPGATLNPSLRYLLVDDVFTTGSTLNSCAAVLRRGGALRLDVVTFGHG